MKTRKRPIGAQEQGRSAKSRGTPSPAHVTQPGLCLGRGCSSAGLPPLICAGIRVLNSVRRFFLPLAPRETFLKAWPPGKHHRNGEEGPCRWRAAPCASEEKDSWISRALSSDTGIQTQSNDPSGPETALTKRGSHEPAKLRASNCYS